MKLTYEIIKNIAYIDLCNYNLLNFKESFTLIYPLIVSKNIILRLSKKQILDDNLLSQILLFASKHKEQKRSFIIISSLIIDDSVFPKKLSWAPTYQEAFDIVEMDELERELK
mgnify:CR=1 FL=1